MHATPLVKSWLSKFIESHQLLHPKADWPEPDSYEARRLFSSFLQQFIAARVTEREAYEVSRSMTDGDIVEAIEEFRRRPPPAPAQPSRPEPVDEAARVREAEDLLGEFSRFGWEFRWNRDPSITSTEQAIEDGCRTTADGYYLTPHRRPEWPDAPRPSADLSERLRKARWEIYFLMGHSLPTAGEVMEWAHGPNELRSGVVARVGQSTNGDWRVTQPAGGAR